MTVDSNSTPEAQKAEVADELTEEQYQLALDAAKELTLINTAVEELRVGYGNASFTRGDRDSYSAGQSKLFAALNRRRSELRSFLVDLG